jgi:hypothetical protein
MSVAYFHERDLGELGIQADVQWAGLNRLAVHLTPDALDTLVENFTDEDRVSDRLNEAQQEGYDVGHATADDEWDDRLSDLEAAWRQGTADDVLEALIDFGRDLNWGHSDALHTLTGILLNQPED